MPNNRPLLLFSLLVGTLVFLLTGRYAGARSRRPRRLPEHLKQVGVVSVLLRAATYLGHLEVVSRAVWLLFIPLFAWTTSLGGCRHPRHPAPSGKGLPQPGTHPAGGAPRRASGVVGSAAQSGFRGDRCGRLRLGRRRRGRRRPASPAGRHRALAGLPGRPARDGPALPDQPDHLLAATTRGCRPASPAGPATPPAGAPVLEPGRCVAADQRGPVPN